MHGYNQFAWAWIEIFFSYPVSTLSNQHFSYYIPSSEMRSTRKIFVALWLHSAVGTYTDVSRKAVLYFNRGKVYSTRVVLRLLAWTSWCFSVVEGNGTNTCIHAFSFLVAKSTWNSIKQNLTWDNLCRNSCISNACIWATTLDCWKNIRTELYDLHYLQLKKAEEWGLKWIAPFGNWSKNLIFSCNCLHL